jgi:hypothetical protein
VEILAWPGPERPFGSGVGHYGYVDTAPPAAADPGAPPRSSRRPRDLLLSLAVLLVPIALLVGIYRVVQKGDEPLLVDAAPVIAQARSAGDFPVAEPTGLPDGWRTLSARYVGGDGTATLRLGYLSPSGAGFQLVESDQAAEAFLGEELTVAARPLGAKRIEERDWQHYAARPGEEALVLLEPERTLLVVGSGPEHELVELASSLLH